jgi:putative FmdB family regulatory protein
MPIYEYECENCGKQCEVIQKFDDVPLSSCPACGGHMHKLVSHTSFILKGTGWYATDYASGKKKTKDAEGKAGGSTEAKTEAVSKN